MQVLVTGGTGYLGRAIVEALARAGHAPTVFARRAAEARLPGTAVDADIRDRDAVARAVAAADAVCHTAALVSLWRRRARDFDDVNVRGLEHVLEACARRGIRRIVYTSSFLALPPAGSVVAVEHNDYQRTKVRALKIARQAAHGGAPLVILAPGVIYGPGAETEGNLLGRLVRDHLARRLPGIVGASRIWPYAYVDDVARAHVRALEAPDMEGGIELALGGENAPQMRAFEIVRELTGRPLPRRIPYAAAMAAAMYEEARARITGRPPRVTQGAVAIFGHDWPLESAAARARLGYTPTPLRKGIESVLAAGGRRLLEPFLH
jgi:nucleoside-diphosphate-sugar epimerase